MEDITQHDAVFNFNARYYTWGELSAQTEKIWFVMHGYGQLAAYFLRKFTHLDPARNYIIAPQGLSKHYLKGFEGRVGAVWMTREDRLNDIANNMRYLQTVYATESAKPHFKDVPQVYMLGFSQGCATLCRWLAQNQAPYTRLILWAGEMPADVLANIHETAIPQHELLFVYGNQDELIAEGEAEKHFDALEAAGLCPKIVNFEGGHELPSEVISFISE
ncbi:alpha/beta hydrolase [Rhodoflexus sp.]